MATLFSDTFADGTLSSAWTARRGTWTESSGSVGVTVQSVPALLEADTDAHAAVADVKVTVTLLSATSHCGSVVRLAYGNPFAYTSSNQTRCYMVVVYTNVSEIYRMDIGATPVLMRSGAVTQTAGALSRLEVTGSGATVTVKQFFQGTQVGADVADGAANRVTAAGQTGLMDDLDPTGMANEMDDFLVEDFVDSLAVNASFKMFPKMLVR